MFFISDVDECDLGTHKCPAHSECVNTQGNYKCRCQTGYQRVESHCEGMRDDKVFLYDNTCTFDQLAPLAILVVS